MVIIGDTMANESITIRFAKHDLSVIDKKIKEGFYTNRSDFVRSSVRHLIFNLEKGEKNLDIVRDIARQKKIRMADIRKTIKKVRPEVYAEVYGDD